MSVKPRVVTRSTRPISPSTAKAFPRERPVNSKGYNVFMGGTLLGYVERQRKRVGRGRARWCWMYQSKRGSGDRATRDDAAHALEVDDVVELLRPEEGWPGTKSARRW